MQQLGRRAPYKSGNLVGEWGRKRRAVSALIAAPPRATAVNATISLYPLPPPTFQTCEEPFSSHIICTPIFPSWFFRKRCGLYVRKYNIYNNNLQQIVFTLKPPKCSTYKLQEHSAFFITTLLQPDKMLYLRLNGRTCSLLSLLLISRSLQSLEEMSCGNGDGD